MIRIAPRPLLAAWELAKACAVDVFRPGAGSALRGLPGWPGLGLPADGLESEPRITLLDALRAFALHERAHEARNATVELVLTGPSSDGTVLATSDVVRTMLSGARKSIVIMGFEISEPTMRKILFRRGLDGIEVTVIGDRQTGAARHLLADWPAGARPLRALENVEPASQTPTRVHGKVIVVDACLALVGSANFTAGGLRNNIEVGVRVTGPVVEEMLRSFERLEKQGWLEAARL